MSEPPPEDIIHEGDDVLLSLDGKKTYLLKTTRGEVLHTHKGYVKHDDIIGSTYGSNVRSSMETAFIALRPLLRDYLVKIARRTQIMYPKDIAIVLLYGNVLPGSVVVEAGTGSGALTAALAAHVRPNGKVYTYEVRPEFIEIAKRNLNRLGLTPYVELKNMDATQGFDVTSVDTVVLDMATPWLAVPHARRTLRGGGVLVSFSPTIDQVIKTADALHEAGFVALETSECLMRRFQVGDGKTRPETLMIAHTGYLTFARKASARL
ncbi:MAG: tRNA (adenine-N1)-methyltransferase [Candidatus Bathyarchaeia archaeon]